MKKNKTNNICQHRSTFVICEFVTYIYIHLSCSTPSSKVYWYCMLSVAYAIQPWLSTPKYLCNVPPNKQSLCICRCSLVNRQSMQGYAIVLFACFPHMKLLQFVHLCSHSCEHYDHIVGINHALHISEIQKLVLSLYCICSFYSRSYKIDVSAQIFND